MVKRVLVVDDDPVIRELIVSILDLEGIETAVAADGDAGLALARAMRPDVVLLDIMMPGMNGYEVCRILKGFGRPPKVVMVTAKSGPEHELAALAAGADLYVRKPFSPADILGAVGTQIVPERG